MNKNKINETFKGKYPLLYKPIINFITVKFHICMYMGSDISYETRGGNNDTLLSGDSSEYSIQPLTGLSSLITLFFFLRNEQNICRFSKNCGRHQHWTSMWQRLCGRSLSHGLSALWGKQWLRYVIFTNILSNQWLHLVLIVSSECYSLIWGSRPPKHAVEKIIRMCLICFICAHSWFLQ